jgi:hypothetical protein
MSVIRFFFFNLLAFDFFFICLCLKMTATDGVWTEQVLSVEGPTYKWPYGARALIAERKRVQEIQSLRNVFMYGKMGNYGAPDIFTFPMSYEESFVSSDTERIGLMNRLRTYYNFNWKRDAKQFQSSFPARKMEADELFTKRIEDVLLLQGLTEELMPETRELINRCTDFEQLLRCMLDAKNENA